MIPAPTDTDPPPSQVPWPTSRGRRSDSPAESAGSALNVGSNSKRSRTPPGSRLMSTWDFITLSVSMAGAQISWTVELGYGTPFLLKLGLKEQHTSLVWLAGPISGLIAQPLIGALSDSSTSKYRRRFWIGISTLALLLSTITLAYCQELARLLVDVFAVGAGDWSEERLEQAKNLAIIFAVVSFYILDFALNGLQASLRNLLLDVTPPAQLNEANAWHGRMINAGSIIGFGFGFLPLQSIPYIGKLGGQFTIFCLISALILLATVVTTCVCHEEEERIEMQQQRNQRGLSAIAKNIQVVVMNLPKPIRRVCYVQLFAFMGWFPFLFYATTYMGQVLAYEQDREPDADLATRKGELALAIQSIVAVVAGIIIPRFATRDRRLMAHKTDINEDAEISRIRAMVRRWRVEAISKGKELHLPVMPFLLRNIWTGALIFFALLMFSTFFISTSLQATIFISLVGICWAVAMWVPFTIIMELLKEPPRPPPDTRRPTHVRNLSTPSHRPSFASERQPLIRRRSFDDHDINPDEDIPGTPSAGGTILGVHNLAIVIPQLIVALVTSAIFRIVDSPSQTTFLEGEGTYYGKHGVGWVLRFGGICALGAAMFARKVPPTPTEKAMRRRLGEMKLLGEEAFV